MNGGSHQNLLDLYAEWGRLTVLEGAAIDVSEWPVVEEQQRRKHDLRDEIIRATQQWQNERTTDEDGPDSARASFERYFRPIVSDLILQEHRNQLALAERRQELQTKLAAAGQSAARLRSIHRSYAPERNPRWQSYS
jgi:hypothetical protein